MTTRNPKLPSNALADWAEAALPGDTYVYWRGEVGKSHDRVFGAARKLTEGGLFATFVKGRDRIIVRLSVRASKFIKAASRW